MRYVSPDVALIFGLLSLIQNRVVGFRASNGKVAVSSSDFRRVSLSTAPTLSNACDLDNAFRVSGYIRVVFARSCIFYAADGVESEQLVGRGVKVNRHHLLCASEYAYTCAHSQNGLRSLPFVIE